MSHVHYNILNIKMFLMMPRYLVMNSLIYCSHIWSCEIVSRLVRFLLSTIVVLDTTWSNFIKLAWRWSLVLDCRFLDMVIVFLNCTVFTFTNVRGHCRISIKILLVLPLLNKHDGVLNGRRSIVYSCVSMWFMEQYAEH